MLRLTPDHRQMPSAPRVSSGAKASTKVLRSVKDFPPLPRHPWCIALPRARNARRPTARRLRIDLPRPVVVLDNAGWDASDKSVVRYMLGNHGTGRDIAAFANPTFREDCGANSEDGVGSNVAFAGDVYARMDR